jgi:SPX domain protein involved in polyphosphate accumulation
MRNELKFVVNDHLKNEFLLRLKSRLIIDKNYNSDGTIVDSLYFDTSGLSALHSKNDGLPFRWKARIRRYGKFVQTPTPTNFFLEIKKRYDNLIEKKRELVFSTGCSINELYKDSERNTSFFFNLKKKYNLMPVLGISYIREAYFIKENPNVRITFDRNLSYSHANLWFQSYREISHFFPKEKFVLEIKANGKAPTYLETICNQMGLSTLSFSKYVLGASDYISRYGFSKSLYLSQSFRSPSELKCQN